jgi:RNA polymerase sigma factor (sigma-70 family)
LELSDEVLVERARMGDSGAFDQLLARHRSRAFSWAKNIVEDTHLAEDVLQEALIQAFLKLGTLFDISKFLPWLQKIVRNQAMMKLRRGGHYAKENPFASFEKSAPAENTDWRDLDTVLYHLSLRSQKTNNKDNILEQVIETQLPETISDMVRVLGAREKQVFEQYFYEQLSPLDIAAYFDTPVNTIHKSLSRIRKKLSLQIYDTQLLEQISEHLKSNGYRSRILAKPEIEGQPLLHPDLSMP